MVNPWKMYISTVDEKAHLLAKEYGLGIEVAEFCTPWFLDREFPYADGLVRPKLACSDRFALHAPYSEIFPCAIDPMVRQVAAERFTQVITIAEGYGIRKIIVHGGYNPRIYYPIWYTEQSVIFWREFVEKIPGNMVFCLENVFEEEPGMLLDIVQQVDDPRIRLCLDVGHVNAYSRISVEQWLEAWAPYTAHFHLHNNDGTRDSHSPLNKGTIPMKQLLAQIDDLCPAATVTLELMDARSSVDWMLEE